ncbi:MAG: hypothetical protein IJ867_00565 [Clostridia bacterium]|nr:hypothetical protein [Clostridia bacterium]
MKSFLEWFRAGTKVKRWIFLIVVGIALVCYAFAEVLTSETMAIQDIILKIVLTFVVRICLHYCRNCLYSKA